MKFPSIKNLLQSFDNVIRRFPFEMLFALIGTIAAVTYIELKRLDLPNENWCVRIIMAANLGLLLSFAASLYGQSKGITGRHLWVFKLAAALLGLSFVFIIDPLTHQADYIRFFLISLALHFLVAFAAFIGPDQIQGFWQFNKTLFLRFLTSALYSVVLFVGIAAAISATNFLFNFSFDNDIYQILWVLIAFIFNTLFFLAGVPDDFAALNEDPSYPKGLKIFTQYVLIPLATVYVLILLAYEVKILIQWNLPKGMVSYLVLSYSVFGILSLLLVFPVREQAENKWIKTFSRSFYFLMLPLIFLLFLAVSKRVFHYGITEFRYFLMALAIWLLFITLYFLISRKQNIKIIPMSLCVLTLLSVYGPQSAFSVSMYSQRKILVNIFKRNHAFKSGKLTAVDSLKISAKEGNRAVATLEYLVDHYDLTTLQPYISLNLTAVNDSLIKLPSEWRQGLRVDRYDLRRKKLDWAQKYLGLHKFAGYDFASDTSMTDYAYSMHTWNNDAINVKGYDYIITQDNVSIPDTTNYTVDNMRIRKIATVTGFTTITVNNESAIFDVKTFINTLMSKQTYIKKYAVNSNYTHNDYSMPSDSLSFTRATKSFIINYKINMVRFELSKQKKVTAINFVSGNYLIKAK